MGDNFTKVMNIMKVANSSLLDAKQSLEISSFDEDKAVLLLSLIKRLVASSLLKGECKSG